MKRMVGTKNIKHMENPSSSEANQNPAVVSLQIGNCTVNVWESPSHRWVFPAIRELVTLFPQRAVKMKSEGKRVICKHQVHLCGLKS